MGHIGAVQLHIVAFIQVTDLQTAIIADSSDDEHLPVDHPACASFTAVVVGGPELLVCPGNDNVTNTGDVTVG